MTPREVLLKAADLIEKPGAWTTGVCARDIAGKDVVFSAPNATCWCLIGAVYRAAGGVGQGFPAFNKLDEALGHGVGTWNDAPDRTQHEVVDKLREVAASIPDDPA